MVFMDGQGRFYQADKKKDKGDAFFTFPTPEMIKVLKEFPMNREEMNEAIRQLDIPKEKEHEKTVA